MIKNSTLKKNSTTKIKHRENKFMPSEVAIKNIMAYSYALYVTKCSDGTRLQFILN
ncbi:MAG: hypothetical protein PHP31_06735 [Lentimicrobiaceae bacterium]|nr:hypothetical protein [Lentimicrobiaceae bacterium]